MTERLTDQENIDMGKYLTPLEMSVRGGGLVEGNPYKPQILNEENNNCDLREIIQFRNDHSMIEGVVAVFDVQTNMMLWKNGLKTIVRLQNPNEEGEIKGVDILIRKDDQLIDSSDLSIYLHPSKENILEAVNTNQGYIIIQPTDAYFSDSS